MSRIRRPDDPSTLVATGGGRPDSIVAYLHEVAGAFHAQPARQGKGRFAFARVGSSNGPYADSTQAWAWVPVVVVVSAPVVRE